MRIHYVKAIKEGQKVTLHQFQFVAHENNENNENEENCEN